MTSELDDLARFGLVVTDDIATVMEALGRLQQLARFGLDRDLAAEAQKAIDRVASYVGILQGKVFSS